LLKEFEQDTASITLIPATGGRFEVTINDHLLYSKLETGRHVQAGEITGLVQKFFKEKK
jgi:selenoprotein W-related protein